INMTFPAKVLQREKYILDQVIDGKAQFNISKITTKYKDHEGEFWVFSQPLRLDNIIVDCSAYTMQQIADFLGCSLLTEKLANLIWMEADFQLTPHIRPITSSTKSMIEHSNLIDKELEGYDTKNKLIAN